MRCVNLQGTSGLYIELFCKYYLYVSKELILLEKDKDFLKQ